MYEPIDGNGVPFPKSVDHFRQISGENADSREEQTEDPNGEQNLFVDKTRYYQRKRRNRKNAINCDNCVLKSKIVLKISVKKYFIAYFEPKPIQNSAPKQSSDSVDYETEGQNNG